MSDPLKLAALLNACRLFDGGEPSQSLRTASGEYLQQAAADPSLLGLAGAALPTLPLQAASWLALILGTAVERGQGAELTTHAVWGLLGSRLAALPVPANDDERVPEPTEEQAAVIDALPLLCQSVVSHLAHMPALREELSRDGPLLDRLLDLQQYSHAIEWVREAIVRCSGSLVVLHPPSRSGLRLKYENVATCFHLFSLVQAAIGPRIPGGQAADPTIADVARGITAEQAGDAAWWHYGDPHSKEPHFMASIWGEASVRSIPEIKGEQVMLLWPPLLGSRSWDSGFFGPHLMQLPADAQLVAPLTAAQCEVWFAELGFDPAPPIASDRSQSGMPKVAEVEPQNGAERPWWKFW